MLKDEHDVTMMLKESNLFNTHFSVRVILIHCWKPYFGCELLENEAGKKFWRIIIKQESKYATNMTVGWNWRKHWEFKLMLKLLKNYVINVNISVIAHVVRKLVHA
jgi:hypothetical protein